VDVAASALLKLTFTGNKTSGIHQIDHVGGLVHLPAYYHLENPTPTPWNTIAESLSQRQGSGVPLVSFDEWLSKLRDRSLKFTRPDIEVLPALRLVDFFASIDSEGNPVLDVSATQAVAAEVNYGLIKDAIIQRYLVFQNC